MTKVKICGLVRREDVACAVESGADALGFIAVSESKRHVTPDQVTELLDLVPPFVPTISVALDEATALRYRVTHHQLYSPPESSPFRPLLRVFRLRNDDSARDALAWTGPILIDAWVDGVLGGSGKTVDWALARRVVAAHPYPVVLAGGLDPENVVEAIRTVRPYAVDVSSGVESSPGVKDSGKIRDFIANAKSALLP
ncbi:MAG: phosphoribosylanthranilate isomerase [Armatimonadota bacterium]